MPLIQLVVMWKLIEFCPWWPWFFFRGQCLGFETRSFYFEMISNGHAFTKTPKNAFYKELEKHVKKTAPDGWQKMYLNAKGGDAQLNIHKTLNLWHSIGHQSQTLPEFKSEKNRLFSTSSGLKTGFVHRWIATFENKFEGLVFKRPKEETWHGFN